MLQRVRETWLKMSSRRKVDDGEVPSDEMFLTSDDVIEFVNSIETNFQTLTRLAGINHLDFTDDTDNARAYLGAIDNLQLAKKIFGERHYFIEGSPVIDEYEKAKNTYQKQIDVKIKEHKKNYDDHTLCKKSLKLSPI